MLFFSTFPPSNAFLWQNFSLYLFMFVTFLCELLNLQVRHLDEDYEEWVNQPTVTKEGPQIFEGDILEVSKIHLSPPILVETNSLSSSIHSCVRCS